MERSNIIIEHNRRHSKSQPLVSIITPTYNHEKFIGECIGSVLAQTYPHWEQIIIDDGSTDRTEEIIAQYNDKRIKYIKQNNIGIWRLSETYNRALEISQGELIAILEGDDFWPLNKLEKQIISFNRPEVVLSWGNSAITNNSGETKYFRNSNLNYKNKKHIIRKLLHRNFIIACTAMCRKDALLKIGGFQQPREVPLVDYPTWLELSLIGEFKSIDEVLGFWRRHPNQITEIMRANMMLAYNRCANVFFQHLPQSIRNSAGLNEQEMQKIYQYHNAYFNYVLARQEWLDARRKFKQALHEGTPAKKAKAFIKILCSYLELDLKTITLLMWKLRLRDFY